MIVGSSQLQFDFIDTVTGKVVDFQMDWDRSSKTFTCSGGNIRHYTFGKENKLHPERGDTLFSIEGQYSKTLPDSESSKAFYLYIIYTPYPNEDKSKPLIA